MTGKPKKQRRALPPGLTKQEEKVLKKVVRRAHRLDNCINICGIKVGWSAIIGIIPAAGDMIDAFMALMVVWPCMQVKIPPALKSRMMLNIAVDFTIGLVPFLGDVADAFFRCNTRNAALLYKHLEARGADRLKKQGGDRPIDSRRSASRTRPSPPRQSSRDRAETKSGPAPQSGHASHSINEKTDAHHRGQNSRMVTAQDIQSPQPAKVKEGRKSDGSNWLSRLTGPRKPETDLENEGSEMTERR